MADENEEFVFTVNEDGGAVYMDRIVGWEEEPINQATLSGVGSTIKRVVVDKTNKVLVAEDLLEIADVIFDELQQAENWPYATGFNFRDALPAGTFSEGDVEYVLQYEFIPDGDEDLKFVSVPIFPNLRKSARSYLL